MYLASRIILFVCGGLALVTSMLTWYEGRVDGGPPRTETAWNGAESVVAILILLLLAGLGALGLAVRKSRLWLSIAEIVGAIVAVVLIIYFMSHNAGDKILYGKRLQSSAGAGAFIGLVAAFGVLLAGVLGLVASILQRPRAIRREEW